MRNSKRGQDAVQNSWSIIVFAGAVFYIK